MAIKMGFSSRATSLKCSTLSNGCIFVKISSIDIFVWIYFLFNKSWPNQQLAWFSTWTCKKNQNINNEFPSTANFHDGMYSVNLSKKSNLNLENVQILLYFCLLYILKKCFHAYLHFYLVFEECFQILKCEFAVYKFIN